jgi:SAM-dependent methyltransferase
MPECRRPDESESSNPSGETATVYSARIASETKNYRDCLDVHSLPEVFHYWSNRYVRPKLEAFGFSTPDEMFRKYARKQFQNGGSQARRLASIGAGNCQLEVDLAAHLLDTGCSDFIIDCFELNPDMLERGRSAAANKGVAARMNFLQVDLNAWNAPHEYDVTIANQILHHVVNLENLFAEIGRSLKPGGSFVVSDMIGRNRHRRWPEALVLVREFWRKLPPSYRFNPGSFRYEEIYEDWDCYGEDFEGIRAQDILPLLIGHFHFELFFAFANIVDPFVGRAFGSNFDPAASWDRSFIDQVNQRDETEIASGRIKPTHLLAVMGNDPGVPTLFHAPLSPEFCLRDPSRAAVGVQVAAAGEGSAYEWGTWPHSDRRELEIACRRLKGFHERAIEQIGVIDERTQWALRLNQDIELAARKLQEAHERAIEQASLIAERTQWALRRDRDVELAARRIEELDRELEERTQWALSLDRERVELEQELSEWTLAHGREMERLAWAQAVDRRFHTPLDRGYGLVRRAVSDVRRVLPGGRR